MLKWIGKKVRDSSSSPSHDDNPFTATMEEEVTDDSIQVPPRSRSASPSKRRSISSSAPPSIHTETGGLKKSNTHRHNGDGGDEVSSSSSEDVHGQEMQRAAYPSVHYSSSDK